MSWLQIFCPRSHFNTGFPFPLHHYLWRGRGTEIPSLEEVTWNGPVPRLWLRSASPEKRGNRTQNIQGTTHLGFVTTFVIYWNSIGLLYVIKVQRWENTINTHQIPFRLTFEFGSKPFWSQISPLYLLYRQYIDFFFLIFYSYPSSPTS